MEGIAAAVLAGARRHTEGGSSLCPQLLVPAACLVVVLMLAVRPVTSGELNAVVLSSEPIVDGVPSNSAIEKENVQLPLVWRFMPPFGQERKRSANISDSSLSHVLQSHASIH